MDILKKGIKMLSLELIYLIGTVIFLIFLNKLNHELIALKLNVWEILIYKNNLPILYFVIALILIVLGICLLIRRIRLIKKTRYEFDELVISILGIVLIFICIPLIIKNIYIPILRAIIIVVGAIAGMAYSGVNGS
ncbi:hypothetical protein JCM31739_10750 [Faecalimonas canis]